MMLVLHKKILSLYKRVCEEDCTKVDKVNNSDSFRGYKGYNSLNNYLNFLIFCFSTKDIEIKFFFI